MRTLPLLLLVALAACGTPAGDDALEPGSDCASATPSPDGPLLLQQPPEDAPGQRYTARTDGPCALLVTFTGAPEGDGPCNVAEYVGRLEPDGEDLRLVVDERHTGQQPGPGVDCALVGAARQMRVTLDAPLGGRRVVDEHGHAISLVDGARVLRFGALPPGWTEGPEGNFAGGPVHWSRSLRGPDGVQAELRQGAATLGTPSPGPAGFGYRELGARTVRGETALLVSFDLEPPGNHILSWTEGERGFALQAMGPLPDPEVLVAIADGLQG